MLGLWLIDRAGRKQLLLIGSIGYIVSLALVAAIFFANQVPLDVAGKAMALKGAEEKLQQVENEGVTGKALQSAQDKASNARQEFLESISQEGFDAAEFQLTDNATHEQAIGAAEKAAAKASEMVGNAGLFVLFGIFAFIASHAVGQGAVIWVLISEVFPNEHRAVGNSIGSGTHWVFAALITRYFPIAVGAVAPGYIFAFFCGMMVLQLLWVLTMVPETKGVPLEQIQKKLGVT